MIFLSHHASQTEHMCPWILARSPQNAVSIWWSPTLGVIPWVLLGEAMGSEGGGLVEAGSSAAHLTWGGESGGKGFEDSEIHSAGVALM